MVKYPRLADRYLPGQLYWSLPDVRVTLNTDDPGIFNLNDHADICQLAQPYLRLSMSDIVQLAKNSFEFLCIDPTRKDSYLNKVGMFEQA
ncbi:MAG: hypothetical protein IIB74_12550 [Proteobacteria bacterium]|nr:hypothetical protein [Pseudomonadota bacterium]